MTYTPDDFLDDLIAEIGLDRIKRAQREGEILLVLLAMGLEMPRKWKRTKRRYQVLIEEHTPHVEWLRAGVNRANSFPRKSR